MTNRRESNLAERARTTPRSAAPTHTAHSRPGRLLIGILVCVALLLPACGGDAPRASGADGGRSGRCDGDVGTCADGAALRSDGSDETTDDARATPGDGGPPQHTDGASCEDECAEFATECALGRERRCEQDGHGCWKWNGWDDCSLGFCADTTLCGTCSDGCPDGGVCGDACALPAVAPPVVEAPAACEVLSTHEAATLDIRVESLEGIAMQTITLWAVGGCNDEPAGGPLSGYPIATEPVLSSTRVLDSLQPDTWYQVRVESTAESGYRSVFTDGWFRTAARWESISVGGSHTCGLKTDGALVCWGQNASGELGQGDEIWRRAPTRVEESWEWAQVAASMYFTCGIRRDQTLHCWGSNQSGQLGIGTTDEEVPSPTQVGRDSDWVAVTTGDRHACATKSDGALYCWGLNADGQVGDGTGEDRTQPVRVGTDSDWKSVTAGGYSCGIKQGGELLCWGANIRGSLGLGPNDSDSKPVPTRVGTDRDWRSVSVGGGHACALKNDGRLFCWGFNAWGQLGNGTTDAVSTPTQLGVDDDWVHVVAARANTCAAKSDGRLFCWGYNERGQVGDGTREQRNVPMPVGTDSDWQSVSVQASTCGIKRDGRLYCWGPSTQSYADEPLPVQGGTAWTAVGLGQSTCGIEANTRLSCWGIGRGFTQSARQVPLRTAVQAEWSSIAVGDDHACALVADGQLYCWGNGSGGKLGDGTGQDLVQPTRIGTDTDWNAVALGYSHTCGVKTDGHLWFKACSAETFESCMQDCMATPGDDVASAENCTSVSGQGLDCRIASCCVGFRYSADDQKRYCNGY